MPYLYYILLSLLLLSACQGEKKSKGDQNQVTVDSAQSRKTTGPKYVKSVQFVYPMKFDPCQFNEELKIVYANNKHYKIDSATCSSIRNRLPRSTAQPGNSCSKSRKKNVVPTRSK